MKYKKVELELPELPPFGTVVEAWDGSEHLKRNKITAPLVGYVHKENPGSPTFVIKAPNGELCYRSHIRPVPAWPPEKGELVACWNNDSLNVRLRFYRSGDGCYPDGARCFSDAVTTWSFIARIPDGKRVFTEEELTPEWFKANSEVMES